MLVTLGKATKARWRLAGAVTIVFVAVVCGWLALPRVNSASLVPPPQMLLGINVSTPSYWIGERSLMNLVSGGDWQSSRDGTPGWQAFDAARLAPEGYVTVLLPGEKANSMLVPPEPAYLGKPVAIRCRWQGKGRLELGGADVKDPKSNEISFIWPASKPGKPSLVWITLAETSPADPVRRIDCRERDASPDAVFSSEFLKFISGFNTVRYLDWQNANANAPVTWETRTRPEFQFQVGTRGMAVEYLVALANEASVDPWFTMPWNTDEDYIRRFAEYIRDTLKPERTVYVELSNEVWNWVFPVTPQASQEGRAAGLASDDHTAALLRYAEKSTWMLKIWTEVFRDTPQRLVRVVGTQNVVPRGAEQILGFRDTAAYVDALAGAPYFNLGAGQDRVTASTDKASLFALMRKDMTASLAKAQESRAVALRYGKRFLAYEAGQHLSAPIDEKLSAELNRDAGMYDIYLSYMQAWREQIGDLMVMYASTASIGGGSAWGIREYVGQPLSDAPKQRAIADFSTLALNAGKSQ